MMRFGIFIGTILILSGCLGPTENPDTEFDTFYKGSPPQDANNESGPSKNDIPAASESNGIQISGENEDWQCTMNCEPK